MSVKNTLSRKNRSTRLAWPAVLLAALAGLLFAASPAPVASQEERGQEVAATLSAGHVLFCVTRDAIFVASVEGQAEPGSQPPAIVPVNSGRIGVILGANEWSSPGSGQKPLRLDSALPKAARRPEPPPRAAGEPAPRIDLSQPTEIEDIAINMLEALRPQVAQIHHKLDLAPDEPLLEILLADYVLDYGPEIWRLEYHIKQQALGGDFWDTRPLRPSYEQIYPPEKGKPRTFIDVSYPAKQSGPALVDFLMGQNAQLDRIASATPQTAQAVAAVRGGTSNKAASDAMSDFLRAALPAVAGSNAKVSIARLDEMRGFQWVLAPAIPPPAPSPSQTGPPEPDRPSLRKYTQTK
jgi:hypothetical protein